MKFQKNSIVIINILNLLLTKNVKLYYEVLY